MDNPINATDWFYVNIEDSQGLLTQNKYYISAHPAFEGFSLGTFVYVETKGKWPENTVLSLKVEHFYGQAGRQEIEQQIEEFIREHFTDTSNVSFTKEELFRY